MEAIAEGYDCSRLETRDKASKPAHGLERVVGRDHLTATGEGRALLEVKIGDDQHSHVRPPERALGEGFEHHAHHADQGAGERLRRPFGHALPGCLSHRPSLP